MKKIEETVLPNGFQNSSISIKKSCSIKEATTEVILATDTGLKPC